MICQPVQSKTCGRTKLGGRNLDKAMVQNLLPISQKKKKSIKESILKSPVVSIYIAQGNLGLWKEYIRSKKKKKKIIINQKSLREIRLLLNWRHLTQVISIASPQFRQSSNCRHLCQLSKVSNVNILWLSITAIEIQWNLVA